MIEETARHAGHADIIRETIDGAVGLYLRPRVGVELARGGAEGAPERLDERAGLEQPQAGAVLVTGVRSASSTSAWCSRNWVRHCGKVIAASGRNSRLRVRSDAAHRLPERGQRALVGRVRAQQGDDGPQPVVGQRRQPDRQLVDPAELVERDLLHGRPLPRGVGRAVAGGERDQDLAQQRADLEHRRAGPARLMAAAAGGRDRQRPHLGRAVGLVRVRHAAGIHTARCGGTTQVAAAAEMASTPLLGCTSCCSSWSCQSIVSRWPARLIGVTVQRLPFGVMAG